MPTNPVADAATFPVLVEVAEERGRQDAKWGRQDHADGTGPDEPNQVRFCVTVAEAADFARWRTDLAARHDAPTFADLLTEETFEALAEKDPAALRAELVQVAAVAVCWIEAIDRRAARPAGFAPGEVVRNRGTGEVLTVTGDPDLWDARYYEPADIVTDGENGGPGEVA
ncbi:hypothetical protein SAMN04489729_4256 [Amycolatopsis lurida]|uniref:Uncharacterized protein n=1 Tax=Amycolatopsis lurida NRRL 2430 TaxID=1460371 RepID=A0A2P2G1S6_AMYLU|nr:hypothetical protein [Amycolatopsis lurida]KFU82915.1 hypothetical protein BB31_00030 [Amycolatopsis lurida NRRL 2430]SED40549.1 hypothetical protein SAMN04489729_4256 [Amycolatopsis lurida]